MDKLVSYYLLCSLQNGGKKHIMEEIPAESVPVIFTKHELVLYFRNGTWTVKENVVGGNEEPIIVV